MPRFKVVLIEHGYASTECERRIVESAGGEFIDAEKLPLAEALKLCTEADGILCRRLQITAEMIHSFRNCKALVRYGVGTDNVDVAAATEAGVMVGHVPTYCIDEVSTHAIALLLACVRRLKSTGQKMADGGWDVHREEPLLRFSGRTLGIVGLGNIGLAVARKLAGWNLNLLAADPFVPPSVAEMLKVKLASFEQVCRESDFISLHCPLLPETHHLINKASITVMKPGVVLVNTARGPVVDEAALLEALASGRIAQAALDVFEEEPLARESPLCRHPNVVVTDHTAWYSEESQAELQRTAAEEVVRICKDALPHSLANPEVLKKLGRFQEWTPPDHVQWQLKRLAIMPAHG